MNNSFAANLNSGSESESSTAAAISGGSQRPHLPQINNGSHYHKGSHLVAASGNLVLENEKILKLFPKCRPRSQNESMNQFYASIKDQHQPPTSTSTAQLSVGGPLLNTNSKPYSSSNATMKKIITENQMMALVNANPMAFNSNPSSSSLCGGGGGGGAKMHPMANKMEKTSTTNPFLTQQREDQTHGMEGGGGGGRRLTHSQSDFGMSHADQQMSGSVGATSGPSLPLSTSSSSLSTEMMSKNFQRHMKNPLNSYQSNPFIGVGNKIDEYEEELNIIVQDQQTAPPEYYFDRRTVRPVDQMQQTHKPPGHSYGPVRSTPVGNILHSPTVDRQDYNQRMTGCPRDRDHHQQQQQQEQQHYLNVGCSPVHSNNGTVAYSGVADERMQNSGPDTSISSLDGFNRNKFEPEKPQESVKSSTNFTTNTKKRNKSVAVVSEGEVVIFDDVEDSWYNLKAKPESIGEGHVYKQNFIADPESVSPERFALEEQERTAPTTGTERGGASVAGMVIGKF